MYQFGNDMPFHPDKEKERMRFVLCVTADGKPQRISLTSLTECIYATVLGEGGAITEHMAEPNQVLTLMVRPGGWYIMSGPGSGAGASTWLHQPCAAEATARWE